MDHFPRVYMIYILGHIPLVESSISHIVILMTLFLIVPVKMILFFRFAKAELIKLAGMAGVMHDTRAPGDYIG